MSRLTAADRAAIEERRVRRVYAALARVYDRGFDWALGPGRRQAVSALRVLSGERVLEVGVGTGLSLPYYPPDCRVTGIDISDEMLDQARERAAELGRDVDLRLMDARSLAFADATFDHVMAPYVISVVPEPDKVMAEIRRVCAPHGTVTVVNHFGSTSAPMRQIEKLLSPLSQWIGFRLDLPIETVTRAPGLEVVRVQKVNLLGMWRLIELRPSSEPQPAR
jgi:phosphatidylethanolamine/phosphatidyl-N-methylethanolamine N-methyltransferase